MLGLAVVRLLLRGGLRGVTSPEPGMSLPETKSQVEAPIGQGLPLGSGVHL